MTVSLLDLDLALRRDSTPMWLGCALAAIAAGFYFLSAQPLNARIDERTQELARIERDARAARSLQTPQKSVLEERLAAFRATLCDRNRLTASVGTVFEQAAKQGLALQQAEYKLDHDKAGGFSAYQMALPVRGAYPKLRAFVDATLAEVACAALDDVDFKRDGIRATQTEARLRLVFFLEGVKP